MPPDGFTSVTISNETAAHLSQVMAIHELDSMAIAIEHASQLALNEE